MKGIKTMKRMILVPVARKTTGKAESYVWIEAEDVNVLAPCQCVAHKDHRASYLKLDKPWTVSELTTGMAAGHGKTRKAAIADAEHNFMVATMSGRDILKKLKSYPVINA
jgi:hypothetical protein